MNATATKTPQNLTTRKSKDSAGANGGMSGLVLDQEHGRVHIHEGVVAKIAGLAVREVQGVHALVPFGAGQTLSRITASLSGDEMKDLGVRVAVGKLEAAVDVRIISDYGESIPKIADAIRENLASRIEQMTGLRLKETNIEVVDLYFADDVEAEPEAPEARVR